MDCKGGVFESFIVCILLKEVGNDCEAEVGFYGGVERLH